MYNYVGPPCCRAEMYAGLVACRPLASRGEYADGTDRQMDGQTDVRQTVTLRFPLDAASVKNASYNRYYHSSRTD